MEKIGELRKKFKAVSLEIMPREITVIFLLMLCTSFCFSLMLGLSTLITSVFGNSDSLLALGFSVVLVLAAELFSIVVSFILHYGFLLVLLRMIRGQKVSLWNLFVGFRQKRTIGPALFFLIPFSIVMIITMIPFFLVPDILSMDNMQEFFQSREQVTRLSVITLVIFTFSYFVIFCRFAFVWPYVYDNPGVKKLDAVKKGTALSKGRFFHFLGFQIAINYKFAIMLIVVDSLKHIIVKFSEVKNFWTYILGFTGFVTSVLFVATIALGIPFYYDSILAANPNPSRPSSTCEE